MKLPPHDTLWHATTAEGPRPGPPVQDLRVDAAVIGAGFTGLSAALAFAEAGVSVAVLEAGEIGAGASGRNAGFVVPHFSRADPDTVRDRLAPDRAEALLSLIESGADHVFALAARLGLGDQAEQAGWLQPAHTAAAAAALQDRVAAWQARGRPVHWLPAGEVAARTGMTVYHGALSDESGGVVNPLALARGLADLALRAGARLHTATPVSAMRREAGEWVLRTDRGREIRADRVLVATNAGTGGAAARLGRTVLPLQVYQIATEPVDAATVARIASRRQPVSDTRTNIFTYRLDADDRLISGGMALIPVAAEARMGRRIAARLARELRLEAVPRIAHVWRGTAAMTRDALPALVEHGPGVWGAIGCNGRGVAFTNVFGAALARWIAAGADPAQAPLPVQAARPLRMRGPGRLAPSAVLLGGMWRDRRAMREGPS